MGVDRPDDADLPANEPADSSGNAADLPAGDDRQARREQIEPRYHQEYYDQLRATDAREQPPPEEQSEAGDRPTVGERADIGPEASADESSPSGESAEPEHWSQVSETTEDGQEAKAAIGDRPSGMSSQQEELSEPGEPAGREADAGQVETAVVAGEQAPSQERSEPGQQTKVGEPTDIGQDAQAAEWADQAELSRWMWGKYLEKWPPEERPPVDRSYDPPGSWRSDEVRYLSPADNAEVEQECDAIADREDKIISPRLREVESCDPNRRLIGFDHRLKGLDRVKEKVYDDMDLLSRSLPEAISLLPDAIRYTFEYDEARYAQGVRADIARMKEQGFELEVLKNFWSYDQYKGINSQWIEPVTGQRFEMQFHTRISAEAKEITHPAYEGLRTHQADPFEELVLEAFQRKVSADIPVPSGAADIPDYPEREEQHDR